MLLTFAAESGLEPERLRDCVARQSTLPHIKQSLEEGRALGVEGTPAFFINGQRLQNPSFRDFKLMIDGQLHALEQQQEVSAPANSSPGKLQ
jgi:protein-disulfide isomerase